MNLSAITVRKDLACVASGRPRVGHLRGELIERIAQVLGGGECNSAVVVGVGNLGHALMCYKGFSNYGMRVLAGFDIDRRIAGAEADGKAVYPMEELAPFVQRTGARIGILAVPASGAQAACDQMVDAGIRGILNFAPAHLRAPADVLVPVSYTHLDVYKRQHRFRAANARTPHARRVPARAGASPARGGRSLQTIPLHSSEAFPCKKSPSPRSTPFA